MADFETFVDRLAAPPVLCSLALVLLLVGLRSRVLWSRAGGGLLGALGLAFAAAGLADAGFRRLLLAPERLPAVVWTALAVCGLWLAMHRSRRGSGHPDSGQPGSDHPGSGAGAATLGVGPWRGPSPGEVAAVVVVGLLVVACAFVLEAPLADPADPGRPAPEPAKVPWFLAGLQEMRFYFDPWMSSWLLPSLLLLALLALPFFDLGATGGAATAPGKESTAPAFFLLGWLLLVLLPLIVGVFLRGPHWQAFGPFEPWDPARPPPAAPLPLSEVVWCRWLGRTAPPAHWLVRELPGLLVLGLYFGVLPWRLPRWKATRGAFDRHRKALGRWRCRLTLALVLALGTVPLKMYSRWLLDAVYWLHLPEISFNF